LQYLCFRVHLQLVNNKTINTINKKIWRSTSLFWLQMSFYRWMMMFLCCEMSSRCKCGRVKIHCRCVYWMMTSLYSLSIVYIVFTSDVFVHKIHSSASQLQSTVNRVRDLMSDPIGKSIGQIKSTLMIDPDVATSHTWVSHRNTCKFRSINQPPTVFESALSSWFKVYDVFL